MDGSVVGPAQQGQIRQVGGAAVEPVPQMVGVAPGQGPFTVGEDTAPSRTARAARWAGWTTRVVRPTSSGWVGAPPRIRGSRAVAAWSRAASRSVPLRSWGWGGGAPLGWWGWGGGWALGGGRAVGGGGWGWWLGVGVGGGRWWVQPLDVAWGWARRSLVGAGVVAGMVAGLAGDQDPGHGPSTGQPPAGLWVQRPGPAGLATHRAGVAQEAVQVHGHRQLGPDPTGLGQPTGLQVAAGQLGQGISLAVAATPGIGGVGRAGQRLQGRHELLAGLGLQQPIDRHHALNGG